MKEIIRKYTESEVGPKKYNAMEIMPSTIEMTQPTVTHKNCSRSTYKPPEARDYIPRDSLSYSSSNRSVPLDKSRD